MSFERSRMLVEVAVANHIDEEVECEVSGKSFLIRVQEVELVRVPMVEDREGGMLNVSDSANSPSVVPSDGRTKRQVVVGDSGSEAEGQDSLRWRENQLWISEGGSSVRESLEQGGVTNGERDVGTGAVGQGDDVVGGFSGPLDDGESPA
ncbi:hypothetical protein V6N12_017200 [Hibiscus sabdariffa]|uniref:Uncharacterized protein n=1 Tax=Hibiscus sabdariffa TaxID=183260 RepID=A0ABR1ZHU8_9ROSI